MSFSLSFSLSFCLFVSLWLSLSVCHSLCLSFSLYLPLCLSVCLSVCLPPPSLFLSLFLTPFNIPKFHTIVSTPKLTQYLLYCYVERFHNAHTALSWRYNNKQSHIPHKPGSRWPINTVSQSLAYKPAPSMVPHVHQLILTAIMIYYVVKLNFSTQSADTLCEAVHGTSTVFNSFFFCFAVSVTPFILVLQVLLSLCEAEQSVHAWSISE